MNRNQESISGSDMEPTTSEEAIKRTIDRACLSRSSRTGPY